MNFEGLVEQSIEKMKHVSDENYWNIFDDIIDMFNENGYDDEKIVREFALLIYCYITGKEYITRTETIIVICHFLIEGNDPTPTGKMIMDSVLN